MKKKQFIIAGMIIIITIPIIINILMKIIFFIEVETSNDWIGFFGSYLGGCLTLVGVYLTLEHNKKQELENQRKLMLPYLIVDAKIKIEDIYKGSNEIEKILALNCSGVLTDYIKLDCKSDEEIVNIEILFNIKNIGIGNALNLKLVKVIIGDVLIDHKSDRNANSIETGSVISKYLSLSNYKKNEKNEELDTKLIFSYEDIFENSYEQIVFFKTHITEIYKPIVVLIGISKPQKK